MHHARLSILFFTGHLAKNHKPLKISTCWTHGFKNLGFLGFTVGHLLGIFRRSYLTHGRLACLFVEFFWWRLDVTWVRGGEWMTWRRARQWHLYPPVWKHKMFESWKTRFQITEMRLFSASFKIVRKVWIWADQLFCFKTFFQKILSHFSTVDSGSLNRW